MYLRFLLFLNVIAFFISCNNCLLSNKENIVARVNGECVSREYYLLKVKLYDININDYQQAYDFLNFIINNILLLQQGKKNKIKITKEELKDEIKKFVPGYSEKEIRKIIKKSKIRYSDWFSDLKEKILIRKEINYLAEKNIKIKDDELKDYFWSNIVNYRKLKKVKARQIVVADKEKADEIIIKLNNGASFEELARKFSITSESEKGGDLGYFSEKDMPAFITNAVFSLKKGQISNVVQSKYGFHIFKCEDILEAETPAFEDVKQEVYNDFFEEKKNSFFNIMMENLRKSAKITIYNENLKKIVDLKEER